MRKRYLLISFGLLFSVLTGCNQLDGNNKTGNYTIKGTILEVTGKDPTTRTPITKPLSGVTVTIQGLSEVVTTDAEGNYQLSGLGKNTCQVVASKSQYTLVPNFKNSGNQTEGSSVNVGSVAENGIVKGADFYAVPANSLTIADVQGNGPKSPLVGKTVTLTGIVTMISNKAANWNYSNSNIEGDDIAQYVGTDGFYLEALPQDKDFTGERSNGIFICTHDDENSDSKWLDGIPTDLKAQDVVTVTGVVTEARILDRFGSSTATLSRTEIKATSVMHVEEGGTPKTAPYPEGVLITYSENKANNWKTAHSYTIDGVTYPGEARVMVHDLNTPAPMGDAINILETLECSVIYIEEPLVVGGTYYNNTGVLPDGGKDEAGNYFRTFNENWCGNVIQKNEESEIGRADDFNEELIVVDYAAFDFAAYKQSLAQTGVTLVDSSGAKVFRGVMDYMTGYYIARPLNHENNMYVQGFSGNYITPYYTTTDKDQLIKNVHGDTVSDQKWAYNGDDAWWNKLSSDAYENVSKSNVHAGMMIQSNTSSGNGLNIKKWRTGTQDKTKFDASSIFTPKWKIESSTSKGNTNAKSLTVASFNLENYTGQGSTYDKYKDFCCIMKNNLLYPDVLVVVEMGDDQETPSLYTNQDNENAPRDGVVSAVKNFSVFVDEIINQGGPKYDFRCIDPKERDSGGKGGVNIRVGFMFNTERVEFVDSGLVSNTYANTHDDAGNLLKEEEWAIYTKDNNIALWNLADVTTTPVNVVVTDKDESKIGKKDGRVHITQSPSYIQDKYYNRSRRCLIGEFKVKDAEGNVTDENFFVIACHLSSKRGDYPLYGSVQPPLLLSEVKRSGQAAVVNRFVQEMLDIDPNARIVVAGDMNEFAYSNPMKVLTGEVNENQILYSLADDFMPKKEQFSYTFQGNYQQIDHIYVTKSLYDKAEAEFKSTGDWKDVCFITHIDSPFTRNNHYNFSDHDADLIRIPEAF